MIITFKTYVPTKNTMVFEKDHPRSLRLSFDEKSKLLEEAIKAWLFVNGKLVGETYGLPVKILNKLENIPDCKRNLNAMYCYTISILKPYQNKGWGTLLKAYWLGQIRALGFTKVIGHTRAVSFNKQFGAKMVKEYTNWFGSDESYFYYECEI